MSYIILYIPNIYYISPAAIWQKIETKPWFYDDNTGEYIFQLYQYT